MTNQWHKCIGIMLLTAPLVHFSVSDCLADEPAAKADQKGQVEASASRGQETPKREPAAMEALSKMGKYLNSLKSFTVTSEMSLDEVLLNGQKILVTGTTEYLTQLPNHLKVTSKIGEIGLDNVYYYDGSTFTIYSLPEKYYTSFAAPATIGQLLDLAEDRYNVELPLRDLFWWSTAKARTEDIISASFIAISPVDGTPCNHYAFQQDDVDWQIWIENDDTPLPRRLVITSKLETGQPQYIARLTWEVNPRIPGNAFIFTPPEGARKIGIAVYDENDQPTTNQ
ncbi:MAG: DUF2092 domain-containing protein [Desulfopila sp.]